ncbi:MAG: hypothetical protein LAO24_04895 [Acidobacteriia bacterium]|nr:hypothetical protein [Terriglobia bacterium]
MKLLRLLAVVFFFAVAANSQTRNGRLEGCPNPTTIAAALEKVQHSRWQDMNVARVQAIWPTELLGASCDRATCSSVESKGRIIGGRYECSEVFLFDVKRGDRGAAIERLNNLVIHYSTSQKSETIEAAKLMAKALGLAESDLAILGNSTQQDFHWDIANEEISRLAVEVNQKGSVWTLTLNFSHFPK